jgi:hypothetical protein
MRSEFGATRVMRGLAKMIYMTTRIENRRKGRQRRRPTAPDRTPPSNNWHWSETFEEVRISGKSGLLDNGDVGFELVISNDSESDAVLLGATVTTSDGDDWRGADDRPVEMRTAPPGESMSVEMCCSPDGFDHDALWSWHLQIGSTEHRTMPRPLPLFD